MRDRLSAINQKISTHLSASGRFAESVRVIAVSKTQPPEAIREAYQLGLRDFGENYADELAAKAEALHDLKDLHWIFIGQLQSNKIQKIVRYAAEIQSVATEKHARYIDRYAAERGLIPYPVWIVVNAGNETTKQGISFAELPTLAAFIKSDCRHLLLKGIMAIPPAMHTDQAWQTSEGKIPELYRQLKSSAAGTGEGHLSLGMSSDLAIAIHAGSDCVRIGTAIFGERKIETAK